MLRRFFNICLASGCFLLYSPPSLCQEVIHAVSGTLSSVDAKAKTITIATDDGSEGLFKDLTKSTSSLDLDKNLRANTTAADASMKKGTRVIIFYFGDSAVRNAVALQNLGSAPEQKVRGTIYKMERHEHLLEIKDASGNIKSFHIGPKTVSDTALGAVEGFKYDPDKGDQVQVISTPTNAGSTALYIGAA